MVGPINQVMGYPTEKGGLQHFNRSCVCFNFPVAIVFRSAFAFFFHLFTFAARPPFCVVVVSSFAASLKAQKQQANGGVFK